jgi:replication factor C subunit 3/5
MVFFILNILMSDSILFNQNKLILITIITVVYNNVKHIKGAIKSVISQNYPNIEYVVIEPNNNGFDKYLIQEIIQDYAKTEILTILKYKKLFKIVVIDKIDNLSYYAQASLRRTMEKYANICKFIFISNQLSKIIEPIKSRCILIKVPLPQNNDIVKTLLEITTKEKIKLENSFNLLKDGLNDNIVEYKMLYEIKKFSKSFLSLIGNI